MSSHNPTETNVPETLAALDPDAKGIPYAVWRARELNELFRRSGLAKEPGRIRPETVEDGLRKTKKKS